MSEGKRIGILGGSFDPLHLGHLALARTAMAYARLDEVLFVVSARPPHKTKGPYASPEQRYAMVRAALATEADMAPCRLEIDRPGPSYTRETLRELKKAYPGASFFLVIGFDMLMDFPSWRKSDEIADLAALLVAHRPGQPSRGPEELEGHYEPMPFEETAVSSTEIRRRVLLGEPYDDLVPGPVAQAIRLQGLYQPSEEVWQSPRAEEFISRLFEMLKEPTFRHCLSTAEFMLAHAEEAGVAPELAVATGLLHDIGKGFKKSELVERAEAYDLNPPAGLRENPKLLHGPVGAELSRREFGIDHEDVYEAIYWHTTGKPGLCLLGQLLYVADYAEPFRAHEESGEARRIMAAEGFPAALRYVSDCKLNHVKTKPYVDPMSAEFDAWVRAEYGEA